MEHTPFRLSVVVPAHNAQAFLSRCVDSVRQQTMADWELLIVENGSTDDTTAVAQQLAQEDSRIRLLHSEKGVSNARNMGIRQATGTHLTFLDADDWLLPDALSFFASMAQQYPCCDVVVGATDLQAGDEAPTVYGRENMEQALVRFLRQPTRYLTVWGKLYRTAYLRDSAVTFDSQLTHAEDSDYLIRLLGDCEQLVVTAHPVYHYFINPTSAVHGGQAGLEEKYRVSLEITGERLPYGEAVRQAYKFYVLDNLLVLLVHDTFRPGRPAAEQRLRAAAVLTVPIFRQALETAPLQEVPLVKRLVFMLARGRRLRLLQLAVRVRQWQNSRR